MTKANKKSIRPATGEEIRTITGHEDHGFITSILKLGATPAQVSQAFQRVENGGYKEAESIIRCICEILEANREMNELAERL